MSSRRGDAQTGQSASNSQPRQNVYFVPRDGIDREVITADICRYLGNDALVRPGTYSDPNTGQLMQGYHITGYRNLTSAMIQSLKEDSARWDSERRSRTSGSSNRFSGTSGAAYPGSDAPGYSGSGNGQQGTYQSQYDNRQHSSGTGQYQGQQQRAFASSSQGGDRYAQQQQGGSYPSQPYGYAQQETPYVNVNANRATVDSYASNTGYQQQSGAYPPGQDPRYYQGQVHAQPTDPLYGRGNYQPNNQSPEYSSTQPRYVYDTQYQNANLPPPPAAQAQDPRATTSSPVSSQAQTGHSAPSSSRHHRERDHRENTSRHNRR